MCPQGMVAYMRTYSQVSGARPGINQQPHPTRTGRLRAAVLAIQASVTMNAKELPNGRLLVPRRAEGPRGEIGEGMVEIGPDDPAFEVWADWLRSRCSDVAQEASDEPDGG